MMKRRQFIQAGAAVSLFNILPSGSYGLSPNGKLRTAHIGVGGMGGSDLNSVASHDMVEVVGLCDVDANNLNKAKGKHPNAEGFRDYRDMLSKLGDTIDAVVVSTPDHTHAPASMTAMNMNKHVYCQKPLAHEVFEARQMRLAAEEKGLVTQMGIQIHSHVAYRMATEFIQSGVIGKVSKAYAWSFKNWGYDGGPIEGEDPVPENLDWDLWIGSAKMRPFKRGRYHPGAWRKMLDFGTGTLGDMGVHIFDTPFRALALTFPNWVKTTCREPTGVGHPEKNIVEYEFPGTEFTTEKLLWTWYDGKSFPPPPNDDLAMPEGQKLPNQGSMFVGEKGRMLLGHVNGPRFFPSEKFKTIDRPRLKSIDHYHSWVNGCLGKEKPSANFTYAGKLTEALLLGVVANRFPGQTLKWDADAFKVTNVPEANKLLQRGYREGYKVPGL
ncbi:MAG: Gfo/Idh/MocA family oxidoreductase [Verrucomicrobiota bacterium]